MNDYVFKNKLIDAIRLERNKKLTRNCTLYDFKLMEIFHSEIVPTISKEFDLIISIKNEWVKKYLSNIDNPRDMSHACFSFAEGFCNLYKEKSENCRVEFIDVNYPVKDNYDCGIDGGEMKHKLSLECDKWYMNHGIPYVVFPYIGRVYIDPTRIQFKKYGIDVGDCDFTFGEPEYFLPDNKNWAVYFNPKYQKLCIFTKWIDDNILANIGKLYLKLKKVWSE